MKFKDLLHYILYHQKYRIISHDNDMNVVSKSNIIKNDNIYNRFNKDNEEYLECNVIGICSNFDTLEIDVLENKENER